ncbi:MAG: GNAT family N-acetyltransferase [Actinobacteria bacterium]|nr:GNAT family N-acetyltransferase [Actinomycetota bacterium]
MAEFEVRAVAAEEVRALRRALLRPHQEVEELVYAGDDHPETLHLGGFRHGRMVGIATIMFRPMPGRAERAAWQVRGMAVDHGHRGYGLGGLLLRRCLAHAAAGGGRLAWCNARAGSFGFYERHGFRRDGEPFELPDIGPHYRMFLQLEPAPPAGRPSGEE